MKLSRKAYLNLILTIVGVILILGILALLFVKFSGGSGVIDGDGKNKVLCDVTIFDGALTKPEIETYFCQVQGECGIFGLSAVRLGLIDWNFWKNTGYATLTMDGEMVKESYTTYYRTRDTVSLSICSDSTNGVLRLTDETGQTIDTINVVVN